MTSDDEFDLDEVQMADVIHERTRIFGLQASLAEPPQFDVAFAASSPADTLDFLRSIPTGTPPEQVVMLAREFEAGLARRRRGAHGDGGGAK